MVFGDETLASVPQGTRAEYPEALGMKGAILGAVLASTAFQLAFEVSVLNGLVLLSTYFLVTLSRVSSHRAAFRIGFLSGILVFAPQLAWFWRIFGPASLCLWAILSTFIGLFVTGLRIWRSRFGTKWLWLAAPVLWTGLEYFRGELYFLRFSWLTVGSAFSGESGLLPVGTLGVYGVGFAICLLAGIADKLTASRRTILLVIALLGTTLL